MRTIVRIKQKMRTHKFIWQLYLRCSYIKNRFLHAERFQKLQTEGNAIIEFIQTVLEDKVFFFFDCGTLLGIIREGSLLKHDDDIDIAVRAYKQEDIETTRKILLDAGCELVRSFSIEGRGIVEDAFRIYDFEFDVFYIQQGTSKDYYYLMYKGPEPPCAM